MLLSTTKKKSINQSWIAVIVKKIQVKSNSDLE